MRLEDLTVVLRPRRSWEAVDLGCVLVRRDYPRILGLWAVTVFPLWAVMAVVLWRHPGWFALGVWWLKPLYDRVPLFFLSRATFGVRPGFLETWREWPRLWSGWLGAALVWRRLSMIRSFALPIWMLEGQRGVGLRQRVSGLVEKGGGTATTATLAFVHLEWAAYFGLFALTSVLAPDSGLPDLEDWVGSGLDDSFALSNAFYWYSNGLYLAAITMIEPFYVGAGFGLYLNCRAQLEGWDVEVAFRKLAGRLRAAVPRVAGVLLVGGMSAGGLVAAAEVEGTTVDPVEAALETVLAREEFEVHVKKGREWVPEGSEGGGAAGLEAMGGLVEVVGWLAVAALVVFLIYHAVRYLRRMRVQVPVLPLRSPKALARVVMGMEITEESLPPDVLGVARQRWAEGERREALSLLYRGALSRLVQVRRVPIEDGDTEDDCLRRVVADEECGVAGFFDDLTKVWVSTAYGGMEATQEQFGDLCERWPFEGLAVKKAEVPVGLRSGVAMLLVLVLPGCGRWEDYEREVGFKGKARVDPFLAAQQFLMERGHGAERSPSLDALPGPHRGVVLTTAENGMPVATARPLLAWVGEGGHLVYAMAGGSPYNDWNFLSRLGNRIYLGNEERPDPVLEALGVSTSGKTEAERAEELEEAFGERKRKGDLDEGEGEGEEAGEEELEAVATTLKWRRHRLALEVLPSMAFRLDRELGKGEFGSAVSDVGGEEGGRSYYVLSLRHGQGRITLLNHAQPLRNRYFGDADHARWLDLMVGGEGREVRFVLGFAGNFWSFLWSKAWAPLTGLALLIGLWLWKNVPRFGPIREVKLHETQRFSDHLRALGPFYLRIHREEVLLAAARGVVEARWMQTHPQLATAEESVRLGLLAERGQLPIERVRAAMKSSGGTAARRRDLSRHLQDLQTLRNAL